MNPNRIKWDFDYHAPKGEKPEKHVQVREACAGLAHALNELLPDSREKSLAMTNLEQVMFWANATLARNPRPDNSI